MKVHLDDRFDFVSNYQLRQSLLSDYKELQASMNAECWKAAVVLAGSIMEALLVDYLVSRRNSVPRDPTKMELVDLVAAAQQVGFLSTSTCAHLNGLREYRNLVHPGRSVRLQAWVTAERSRLAHSLVDIVTQELKKYEEAHPVPAKKLLKTLEADKDKLALLPYLLSGMEAEDVQDFLTCEIPNRYIDLITGDALIWQLNREQSEELLIAAYERAFDRASRQTKRKCVRDIIETMKTGVDFEVMFFSLPFFRAKNLKHVPVAEALIAKDYVLSFLKPTSVTAKGLKMWEGLESFLRTKEDIDRFVGCMVSAMLNSQFELDQVAVKTYLHVAIHRVAKPAREHCKRYLQNLISGYRNGERHTEADEVTNLLARFESTS